MTLAEYTEAFELFPELHLPPPMDVEPTGWETYLKDFPVEDLIQNRAAYMLVHGVHPVDPGGPLLDDKGNVEMGRLWHVNLCLPPPSV